ncbi:MAG: hypothetical protein JEY91_02930 [Spirochaetaceae bacterium]|nr:hypothetical protein [Spirochaetaceae bacterium]
MKLSRIIVPVILLTGVSSFLFGEGVEHETSLGVEFAYYLDNNDGYGQEGGFLPVSYTPVETSDSFSPALNDYAIIEERSLGSGWGSVELQAYVKHRIKVPFLQGDNALNADNNVNFKFDLYAAPVAAYIKASATITPIAFLNFDMGGMIGTGWNAKVFNGIGNNVRGNISEKSFPGVVTELWSSATLQFDLAAIIPGEWTHVVALINAKFLYSFFSTEEAGNGAPWQWLADRGENLNGWEFEGSYFLGYQMPLALDTLGFLIETSQLLGPDNQISTMADGGWGSDFIQVTFGPLGNFTFDEHNSLAVLIQFQTGLDYTNESIFNQFYQNRSYEDTYVKFNRIALAYNYKF